MHIKYKKKKKFLNTEYSYVTGENINAVLGLL